MYRKSKISIAVTSALATSLCSAPASAEIEEVVVTATKRTESTQDIPVAVSALGQQSLEELGITNFTDYLVQLPGVSAGGSGPGQKTIYIRGVASTTPNLTTAGVAGLAPNVALYLDEQPLSQPGRNLDVYAADLARVEVLPGPQGTLFGASSQAGTVRLITNRPEPGETYGSLKAGASFTTDGEPSDNVEAMLNLSFSDTFAVRGVIYVDNKGGFIDNVAGTLDASESARFRPEGTVRDNGVPVSAQRAGFQSTADLSGVTFLEANNSTRTEEDINETTYSGMRISALYDLNPDWTLTVAAMQQSMDSEGVFFADPDLGDLETQRYQDESLEDEFINTNWTLEGRLRDLELVYTGAFTDRDTDQFVDYSDYLFVGQYLPYYICDGSVSYPGAADPAGTCYPPNLFVKSTTRTEVMTHEFRFNTPAENRFRATAGVFYSDLELAERNDFTYPGSTRVDGFGVQTGFSPNFPFLTGFTSDPGPFPDGVIFRNDILRTDEQLGVFGEATFDFTDHLALTVGARWYDIEVDFAGGANSSFCNLFQPDVDAFGTDISDLYNGDDQVTFRGSCDPADHITYTPETVDASTPPQIVAALENAPNAAETDGVIGKVSLSWTPFDRQLYYVTWSEGFRPGLLNRPGGAEGPGGFTVPFALDTDEVTNMEIGWKADFLDNTLRFNGNVFFVEIDRLQTTIFDPSITNLFFSDNAADAEVQGIEGDVIWQPSGIYGLTVIGAFSMLDTEITNVITPTDDVREGDELAYAPELQFNARARYEWEMDNGWMGHVMPNVAHSSEQFSDVIVINRARVDGWTMFGITAGVSADEWMAEIFVENLTDERAELARNFVFDRQRVTYARPRTVGLRISYDF